ncbi:hypothetical protein [Streptomyces griseocarneus]|uniref:hypothetical protein n=1 Tax=Streptomyces griseocarneus TaxID=51201 RepID=UPI00167DA930|nr:hypothetical protein [Streptomyces griseocarneus]MBZ6472048.1 hypothetical protein [Streptomyces griseocarneus]GHG72238.1 hypothetical protein GCM10018779_47750 [Streptomyces griseocarneus]
MPKTVKDVTPTDPESLADLRRDCARMAPHWTGAPPAPSAPAAHTPLSLIHGVRVPDRSARLLDGMSEYGD